MLGIQNNIDILENLEYGVEINGEEDLIEIHNIKYNL